MNSVGSTMYWRLFSIQVIQGAFIKLRTEEQILSGTYSNGPPKTKTKRAAIQEWLYANGSIEWDKKYRKGIWNPDEPIEYSFDGSLTFNEKDYVNLALEYLRNFTCLDFKYFNDDHFEYRLVFRKRMFEDCYTDLGRGKVHGQAQYVTLGPYCYKVGIIVHEVMHALGFIHEHQRPDRDGHIFIAWTNLPEIAHVGFEKRDDDYDDSHYSTLGLPYDYGSIMHYPGYAQVMDEKENKVRWKQTIGTSMKAYQLTIGMHRELSFYDLKAINLVYCADQCSTSKLKCGRGGFLHPRNCSQCICPHGFTGSTCGEVSPYEGRECGGVMDLSIGREYTINTPSFPEHHIPVTALPKGQSCTWLLKAPIRHIVEIRIRNAGGITGFFEWILGNEIFSFTISRARAHCDDYIEVKNTSDFANTGMRFCGNIAPKGPIYSETREMLVLFRSNVAKSSGFGAFVKAIKPEEKSSDELSWAEPDH